MSTRGYMSRYARRWRWTVGIYLAVSTLAALVRYKEYTVSSRVLLGMLIDVGVSVVLAVVIGSLLNLLVAIPFRRKAEPLGTNSEAGDEYSPPLTAAAPRGVERRTSARADPPLESGQATASRTRGQLDEALRLLAVERPWTLPRADRAYEALRLAALDRGDAEMTRRLDDAFDVVKEAAWRKQEALLTADDRGPHPPTADGVQAMSRASPPKRWQPRQDRRLSSASSTGLAVDHTRCRSLSRCAFSWEVWAATHTPTSSCCALSSVRRPSSLSSA